MATTIAAKATTSLSNKPKMAVNSLLLTVIVLLAPNAIPRTSGFQISRWKLRSNGQLVNEVNHKSYEPSTITNYIVGDRMLDTVQELPDILDQHPLLENDGFLVKALQKKEDECLPGCEHGFFTSVTKRAKLHYRRFLPKGKPKGIVIWMHGITSFSGVAFNVEGRKMNMALMSETLTKQGYACYAFDMYGHGYSEGVRHYVKNWKHNLKDYQNFVNLVSQQHDYQGDDHKDAADHIPIFLCGESYGGCLSLHLAHHYQEHPEQAPKGFDSIILLAPAVQAEMPPYPVYFALRYGLAPLFPRWIPFFMPHPVCPENIWRDETVRALHDEEIQEDISLGGGGKPFRLGTAVSLIKALKTLRKRVIPKLKVPFCVIHGVQDYAIPIEGTEHLLKHAQTPAKDRAVLRLKEAYHDLLADPDAERTVNFITQWIDNRLDKKRMKKLEKASAQASFLETSREQRRSTKGSEVLLP